MARKRGRRITSKVKKQKPTARNQQKQLLALSKKVDKFTRNDVEFAQFKQTLNATGIQSVNQFLLTQPPSASPANPNAWSNVFQGNLEATNRTNITIKEYDIDLSLQVPLDEVANRQILHVFLVQPRKQSQLLTDGQDNGQIVLNADQAYTIVQDDVVHINPAMFKVLRKKVFRLGSILNSSGSPGVVTRSTVVTDYFKRWRWKVRRNDMIKSLIGNWSALKNDDVPIHQRLYILTFSTDTTQGSNDLQLRYNVLLKSMYT